MEFEIPLDKIYYLNLDHRTDRREHFEMQVIPYFQGTPLESRIERFPAVKHSNGALGCSISHLEMVKKAKAEGYRYVMILEDDFEFLVSKEVFLEHLSKLFTEPQLDFKVVMLAYNALHTEPYNEFLDKTTNSQTTAGYILNGAYYDELIKQWEYGVTMFKTTGEHWHYTCDQSWKGLQKEKWFIFKTRIGKQMPGYSDCGNQICDNQC